MLIDDRRIGPELLVVPEEAEVRSVGERFVTIPTRGQAELVVRSRLQDGEQLRATAAIVVTERVLEAQRDQRLFVGRQAPLVVRRGDVMHFGAKVEARPAEQRSLDAERIAWIVPAELIGGVAVDDGVVELAVIEDRRREPERGGDAVDGGKQVLSIVGSGRD